MINFGNTTISHSLLSSNIATETHGGGARSYGGVLQFINSTISGNISAGRGAGLRADNGSVEFISSTVAFNTAATAGGGVSVVAAANVQALSSIFSGNQSAFERDFSGTMNSLGWSLVQNSSGTIIAGTTTGNRLGVNPFLQPLADNGGPTFTHKLASNSPAIDAGTVSTNTTDQRGIRRPFDIAWATNSFNAADIGAFEYFELVPYLILSNRTASGFTLAWASNTVLQKASGSVTTWFDQTNLSPLFVSTLTNPANFFRLRAVMPLAIITTNNQTTNSFDLSWPDFGILERAPAANGPWDPLTGTSPFRVNIIPGQTELFRLRVLEH